MGDPNDDLDEASPPRLTSDEEAGSDEESLSPGFDLTRRELPAGC